MKILINPYLCSVKPQVFARLCPLVHIALFSTFIPCGVWEAVQIIEGLLKNVSDIQPKIVHGDTQAQSTVVFALAYLLGIQLMPRYS